MFTICQHAVSSGVCHVAEVNIQSSISQFHIHNVFHSTDIDRCWGQHWKIMPLSCAMLPSGWLMLTVNVYCVIWQNICNRFVSSSMRQQHRVGIDLPNTEVGPKNWPECMVLSFMPCSQETWIMRCHVPWEHEAALTKPGNIVYCCTSHDLHWTNHDRIIEIVI